MLVVIHFFLEFKIVAVVKAINLRLHINFKSQKIFVVEFKGCQIVNRILLPHSNKLQGLALLQDVRDCATMQPLRLTTLSV